MKVSLLSVILTMLASCEETRKMSPVLRRTEEEAAAGSSRRRGRRILRSVSGKTLVASVILRLLSMRDGVRKYSDELLQYFFRSFFRREACG